MFLYILRRINLLLITLLALKRHELASIHA